MYACQGAAWGSMTSPRPLPPDEGAIHSSPRRPQGARQRSWVLAAAVFGSTLAYVDGSVVNVALPRIESDLHTTLATMQWVVNAYTLCMAALLLVGGVAADRFGRRLIFVAGVSLFAAASLACGFAGNVWFLIGARALQGIGGALLIPCSLALIGAAYDEGERGAAIGIWSGASAIAAGVAPLIGGVLLDHWTWRVIFLINPALAIPTLWIALRRVPESREAGAPAGIDWAGAVLALAGLGSVVFGLIESSDLGWGNPAVVAALLVGCAALVAFVFTERHSRAPIMPLELFRSPRFSGVNLLTLQLYGALGVVFFFLPFLLLQARGYSAAATGGAYLPFTLVLGVLSRWGGGLVDRFGERWPLIAGPALTSVGFVALAGSEGLYGAVLLSMTVLGLGMAATVAPLTTTVLNAVPPHRTGVASGINNTVAQVGSLLAIALLGSITLSAFNRSLDRHLSQAPASENVRSAVHGAHGAFVMPPLPARLSSEERQQVHQIVSESLISTVQLALWIAAALALSSAVTAALTIPAGTGKGRAETPG
jgi:EmrB/QacA subfamily drug resistance transporter